LLYQFCQNASKRLMFPCFYNPHVNYSGGPSSNISIHTIREKQLKKFKISD